MSNYEEKVTREPLWFGDMTFRTFINTREQVGIVILKPKHSTIDGHIAWTITRFGSYIRLFATPALAETQGEETPVSYNCDFSKIVDDHMLEDSVLTWKDCEVTKSEFINFNFIFNYIGNKSLAYMFNAVVGRMFNRMYYNRPKTNPNVNFKPLSQQNTKYLVNEDYSSIWFPLHHYCAVVWSPVFESKREILFIPNRLQLHSLNAGNLHNPLTNLYRNDDEVTKKIFIKRLLSYETFAEGSTTAQAINKKVNSLYLIQADLWYNLITQVKTYRR